ncbi:MAG TPA: type II toxin-antitoxin system RelE/ParE family toxin [Vicinamibacterales bacterium]|nr:type II toxin-antitoxin system RelE/ParE family toxin [Vicinamibacterales bacterium]
MKERPVQFTKTAAQHVENERAWWLANRNYRELFATELESALQILAVLPGAGTPYTQSGTPGLRRLYVRKLSCHLYYTFDDELVIVRAMWGARRERGPNL